MENALSPGPEPRVTCRWDTPRPLPHPCHSRKPPGRHPPAAASAPLRLLPEVVCRRPGACAESSPAPRSPSMTGSLKSSRRVPGRTVFQGRGCSWGGAARDVPQMSFPGIWSRSSWEGLSRTGLGELGNVGVHQEPGLQSGFSISTPTREVENLRCSPSLSAILLCILCQAFSRGHRRKGSSWARGSFPLCGSSGSFCGGLHVHLFSPYPTWALSWFPPELC